MVPLTGGISKNHFSPGLKESYLIFAESLIFPAQENNMKEGIKRYFLSNMFRSDCGDQT